MSTFIEKACGERIQTVEICSSLPAEKKRTAFRSVPSDSLVQLINRVAETAPTSGWFKDDPRMPRFFVRITGNGGQHTIEVQPVFTFLGEWLYTPDKQLWRCLEGLA